MFKKIDRPNRIYQEVASQIEEVILSGKLKIGDRLPAERQLAETLDISRRTLRESLRVVEQKGLIEIRTTGTFVKMATTEKLSQSLGLVIRSKKIAWKDIVQFRTEMESNIVLRAAQLATEKDIAELDKIIEKTEALMQEEQLDWNAYLNLDFRMHLTLAKIVRNPIYGLILRTFLDNLMPYYEAYRSNKNEFSKKNLENMKSIVEAIKRGDGKSAQKAIIEHLTLGDPYMKKAGNY